ncbi:hypothetical protein niasHT_000586 [Heterodera trifolii]|uniref:B30.2/SPRY domain-containing protein n=1 Tax=Heterodera trifolii TaxID=157864 RepID=A0ABD2LYZ7_9BILA
MSISTNSINYGDDFTPAENEEVNADAINLDNDGQFDGKNGESIADQQQLKEFREKFARMEMELKIAKLELENKEQKLKHHELIGEQKALKEKMAKIEQEKEKNVAAEERFSQLQNDQTKKLFDKLSELEKQQKEQSKANSDQLSKMQNDQKIILEKISEFEKEQKQRKALLNFQHNYWDANFCHENLEIIGDKNLIVHYKGNTSDFYSVFAVHPILQKNNPSDIFYYEISVKNKKLWMSFGFAVKQQNKLNGIIRYEKGTYGKIWINGERKGINVEYSYGVGDTVGIGVNSATRQISFTKNGLRLGWQTNK